MTTPSREEVARDVAKAWGWDDTHDHRAESYVTKRLDAQARAGFPALIGTTHEGCETCDGDEEISDPSGCGDPEHCPPFDVPCPDGRPVYWTVSE